MTQYHWSPGSNIVDVAFVVGVENISTAGARDEYRFTAHATKGAHWRVHTTGNHFAGIGIKAHHSLHTKISINPSPPNPLPQGARGAGVFRFRRMTNANVINRKLLTHLNTGWDIVTIFRTFSALTLMVSEQNGKRSSMSLQTSQQTQELQASLQGSLFKTVKSRRFLRSLHGRIHGGYEKRPL